MQEANLLLYIGNCNSFVTKIAMAGLNCQTCQTNFDCPIRFRCASAPNTSVKCCVPDASRAPAANAQQPLLHGTVVTLLLPAGVPHPSYLYVDNLTGQIKADNAPVFPLTERYTFQIFKYDPTDPTIHYGDHIMIRSFSNFVYAFQTGTSCSDQSSTRFGLSKETILSWYASYGQTSPATYAFMPAVNANGLPLNGLPSSTGAPVIIDGQSQVSIMHTASHCFLNAGAYCSGIGGGCVSTAASVNASGRFVLGFVFYSTAGHVNQSDVSQGQHLVPTPASTLLSPILTTPNPVQARTAFNTPLVLPVNGVNVLAQTSQCSSQANGNGNATPCSRITTPTSSIPAQLIYPFSANIATGQCGRTTFGCNAAHGV